MEIRHSTYPSDAVQHSTQATAPMEKSHLWVQLVGQALKVDACCADLLVSGVIAMSQVAARGEVQAHDAVMGLQECGVGGKVCRTAKKQGDDTATSHRDAQKVLL